MVIEIFLWEEQMKAVVQALRRGDRLPRANTDGLSTAASGQRCARSQPDLATDSLDKSAGLLPRLLLLRIGKLAALLLG